jgi:predicted  nucleic acid-binding Zn-ribbon protein
MWNKLLDFGKQLFALKSDVQQGKENDKEMRQDIKELQRRIDSLTDTARDLAFELRRQRDNAERDQKNLLLQLENTLFRHERGLLPGSPLDSKPDAE